MCADSTLQGGAGKDTIAGCLAEKVVLIGPPHSSGCRSKTSSARSLGTAHERGVTVMDALVPCL
jgi:hypothetical protein